MYKEHPAFEEPEDESAKIWRYIDFVKIAMTKVLHGCGW